jgi:hypothetical protein
VPVALTEEVVAPVATGWVIVVVVVLEPPPATATMPPPTAPPSTAVLARSAAVGLRRSMGEAFQDVRVG